MTSHSSPTGSPQFQRVILKDVNPKIFHTATVRWRGKLQPNKDEFWVGLEYDNDNKGKHSGLFKEFQLFNTFFSKSGGTFMKQVALDKLLVKYNNESTPLEIRSNPYSSFFDSLKTNYPDFFTDGERDFQLDYINIGGKQVENVGIKYRVKKLISITLRNELILFCDNEIESKDPHNQTFPILPETLDLAWLESITSLDLSLNFIKNLSILNEIISACLSGVKSLSLSGNEISFNSLAKSPNLPKINCFHKLETLHLNSTNLSFTDLDKFLVHLPNLEKLEIMDNLECFHEQNLLEPNINTCPSLKSLDISFNRKLKLIPWQFSKMFPNLVKLSVNACDICDQVFDKEPGSSVAPPSYKNLLNLDIIKNNLTSITAFDKMVKSCPNLQNLSYSQNNFQGYENGADGLETGTKNLRQIAIAKIRTTKVLNRSEIGTKFERQERLKAEYDYLRKFKSDFYQKGLVEEHPTYKILEDLHGKVEDTIEVKKHVNVKLELFDGRSVCKKLPLTILVSKLKIVCKKLFKLGADFSVVLILHQQNDHRIEMNGDNQKLDFYSPFDNDVILVTASDSRV